MAQTVLFLDTLAPATIDRLRPLVPPGFDLAWATSRDDAHLQDLIRTADYAVSGQVAVPGALLRAATRLRLLHKWGVGTDNFDLDAARELRIPVARTAGCNAVPVAEFTLGLAIACMRNIAEGHAALARGHWTGGNVPRRSLSLSGKTVGILGFGAIGQALARLLAGFGCPVLYHQRHRLDPAAEAALNASFVPFDDLLARSEILSLHCPLTPETEGLLDAAALARMKPGAVLLNVARGGIVVEAALLDALRSGALHAAAADVFATEPLPPGSPLVGVPGLLLTPHVAAIAAETFEPTIRQLFANVLRVAAGQPVAAADLVP